MGLPFIGHRQRPVMRYANLRDVQFLCYEQMHTSLAKDWGYVIVHFRLVCVRINLRNPITTCSQWPFDISFAPALKNHTGWDHCLLKDWATFRQRFGNTIPKLRDDDHSSIYLQSMVIKSILYTISKMLTPSAKNLVLVGWLQMHS